MKRRKRTYHPSLLISIRSILMSLPSLGAIDEVIRSEKVHVDDLLRFHEYLQTYFQYIPEAASDLKREFKETFMDFVSRALMISAELYAFFSTCNSDAVLKNTSQQLDMTGMRRGIKALQENASVFEKYTVAYGKQQILLKEISSGTFSQDNNRELRQSTEKFSQSKVNKSGKYRGMEQAHFMSIFITPVQKKK